WLEEKVSVDYVLFEPSAYGDLEVTAEEIEAYFAENDKAYEMPREVNVKYLRLAFDDFEGQAEVTEEQVQAHFDLNKDDYGAPKRVSARHILFKIDQGADQEAVDEARKKAAEVLAEASSGKDFAELAKEYSDDTGSKTAGGDLGFFTRDRMVKPFSDAAFAMEIGEISEPVKSPFGWHIIKVEAIEEAREPDLAEAAEQIRTKLKKDTARSLAFDRSEDIYDACYEARSIVDVAATQQLQVHETGFFSEGGAIEGIKEARKFAEVAFALPENEPSEPLELQAGYYILQRIASKPANIPELETVKDKVKKDLIEAKREELAKGEAETFLADLTGGADIREAAASRKLEVKSTEFFQRSGAIPGLGYEQDIQKAAFSLSEAKRFPDNTVKGRKGYYVISLKTRQEPDVQEFEEKKTQITSGLLAEKRQRTVQEFIDQLREQSVVTIQDGFLG
ncbi:MAG: peptidylprolyl isomerase, partial [Deltaproteobacteria bacterium]|nr:peptidylprolyl isomerase [Deltaproteobacteria bacterium]